MEEQKMDAKTSLKGRSFLTLKDFTPEEIGYFLDLAAKLKADKKKGITGNSLKGKNIALLFEKPSTRTRCSFTIGCVDEGAHPEYLGKDDIQLGHKESVEDTARVLGRMFDGIEFRGFLHENVEKLAKYSGVPVWNGLTDDYHPTQILADFLTLREQFGEIKGLNFVFAGDGRNNMSNSLMIGCSKMGLNFTCLAPKSLWPKEELVKQCEEYAKESGAKIRFTEDVKEAVEGADCIYTDVWASMGEEDKAAERIALLRPYQVNKEMLEMKGKDTTVVMHCLPAVKGHEITEDVFEHFADVSFDEAENRMHTIKAVMVATLGESTEMSGESSSRSNLDLPKPQQELLKALVATGKPIVIVLFTGRPLTINWEKKNLSAILNVWFGGTEAAYAIGDVLFGDVNPSGKLTSSWPQNVGQFPLY